MPRSGERVLMATVGLPLLEQRFGHSMPMRVSRIDELFPILSLHNQSGAFYALFDSFPNILVYVVPVLERSLQNRL